MMKRYLSISQQIHHLIADKDVDPASLEESYFKEKTYLDLVTPYTDLISVGRDSEGKHKYPPSVSFERFLECNRIDDAISSSLRHSLGLFEKSFKSFIADSLCKKMHDAGDTQTKDFSWIEEYIEGRPAFDLISLDKELRRGIIRPLPSEDAKIARRKGVLDELRKESCNPNPSNLMAKHYLTKYGYIPMFVLVHMLSMGELLTIFEMLPMGDRIVFVRFYLRNSRHRIDGIFLDRMVREFKTLVIIRNITNHYEPIFPFILNYQEHRFSDLLNMLGKLRRHCARCVSSSEIIYNQLTGFPFAASSYSSSFAKRIEDVVRAISHPSER